MVYNSWYMLQLSGSILGRPVVSMRTNSTVGKIEGLLVNPDNLKIEAFWCRDRFSGRLLLLLRNDIRGAIPQGILINDNEVFSEPEDLVRLKDIITLNYDPMSKLVVTTGGKRLGRVVDFAVEMSSMYVQKIYVNQNFLKSLGVSQLSIDRTQITEITDKKIVVQEPLQPEGERMAAGVLAPS